MENMDGRMNLRQLRLVIVMMTNYDLSGLPYSLYIRLYDGPVRQYQNDVNKDIPFET